MRGKIAIGAVMLTLLIVGLISVSFAAGSRIAPRVTSPRRLHVIEHGVSDHFTDLGKEGDSAGDLLTFHNPIFNRTNSKRIGHDQGDCIRISPKRGILECRWITFLPGGSITVEGPFLDRKSSTLAITGGTGDFGNVRGSMSLKGRSGGFDLIFHLLP
jgi:allene oxide cyclase